MAYQKVSSSTIDFFIIVYDDLIKKPMRLCDLARSASMTPQGARVHVQTLAKRRYIKTSDFRHWELNPMALIYPFDSLAVMS